MEPKGVGLTVALSCGELGAVTGWSIKRVGTPSRDERWAAASGGSDNGGDDGTVSLQAAVPQPLLLAMRDFIERHPSWDQYRLFQAALAGFLMQNGIQNRGVTRCYLANLFPGQRGFSDPYEQPGPKPVPLRPHGDGPSPARAGRQRAA